MNSFEFILSLISFIFGIKPSTSSLISNLNQIKGHLIQFSPNELKFITEIDVLFEIHVLVSRVTVFDEIRENSYMRKSPCITWFKPKTNSNHSITLIIISLSSN